MNDTLPWDPSRPNQSRPDAPSDFYAAGCPVGYFAQIVPPGSPDAVEFGNPLGQIRCRLVDTTTPVTQVDEAGADLTLAWENAGRYNLASSAGGTFPWAMAGVAALGLLIWQRIQSKKK